MSTESRIETRREDWKAVVSVIGPLDPQALRDEIDKLVKSGLVRIDLDLSRVKRMDSTAIGELVAVVIAAANCGAKVSLVKVPGRVQEILNIVNLTDLFK